MNMYVGVDGGGTKTLCKIVDESGQSVFENAFGPINLNSIGEDRFRSLVKEILDTVAGVINEKTPVSCKICFGLAGVSNPKVSEIIRDEHIKSSISEASELMVVGDDEIALVGGNRGRKGMLLIAGTGSVCIGYTPDGTRVRTGGYGHLIDDVGSGYSLGRDALSAVVKAEDGRGSETALRELIFSYWEITSISELIAKTYSTPDKKNIAALSRLVEEAAAGGDAVAQDIIRTAAQGLYDMVIVVASKMPLEGKEISFAGGLLANDTRLKKELIKIIERELPEVSCHEAYLSPVDGACLLAKIG